MIHAISAGYHPLSSPDVLRRHFAHVKSHSSTMWVDTFGTVACYVAERDASAVTTVEATARGVSFVIDGAKDQPPYTVPLTIVVHQPGGKNPGAWRDKVPLPCQVKGDDILVSAAPSKQPILVTWN